MSWEEDEPYEPKEIVHATVESLAKGDYRVRVMVTDSPRALSAVVPEIVAAFIDLHGQIAKHMAESNTTE